MSPPGSPSTDIFNLLEGDKKGDERAASGEKYGDEITVSTAYSLPIAALFDEVDRGSLEEGIDGVVNPDGIFNLLASFEGNPPETQG